MSGSRKNKDEVEMFKRINRLKIKAGGTGSRTGQIDPKAIKAADKHVTSLCEDCPKYVDEVLQKLVGQWADMKAVSDKQEKEDHRTRVFNCAHEVKDLAGMCGYPFLSELGESLRDYIMNTKLNADAQHKIVQAHVDAMKAAHRGDVREGSEPVAKELMATVKKAIEKHG